MVSALDSRSSGLGLSPDRGITLCSWARTQRSDSHSATQAYKWVPASSIRGLKELRHDFLSHFFDGLNCGSSVGKPKNNGLLMKKNTKGVKLKQKGTRMAEDGED